MTSLISNLRTLILLLLVSAPLCFGQEQDITTRIAELKRMEAMEPENPSPKYQTVLACLNYAVMNPHAEPTERLLAEAEQSLGQLEQMKNADPSNNCALRGYLYMVRIVQDPATNGQRYYMDVQQYFEKALKLNPDNALAKQLQEKFQEGMRQAGR
jgi:hypothetical protein